MTFAVLLMLANVSQTGPQAAQAVCGPLTALVDRHPAIPILVKAQAVRREQRQQHARQAEGLLDTSNTADTWTHFARGIAAQIREEIDLYADQTRRIVRHFMKAIDLDPANDPAVCHIVHEVRYSLDTALVSEMLTGVERARARHASLALDRAFAELSNRLGHTDAVAQDERLIRVADARAALAHAYALLRTPSREEEGYQRYLGALERASPADLRDVLDEIRGIVNQDEQKRWEKLSTNGQRDFLKSFWELRAARAGLRPVERAAEHYRRLAHVSNWYLPRSNFFSSPLYQSAPRDTSIASRREVYLRYGPPESVLRSMGTEGWLYSDPGGGPRSFGFSTNGVKSELTPPNCPLAELLSTHDARYGRHLITCMMANTPARRSELQQRLTGEFALEFWQEYNRTMQSDRYRLFTADLPFIYQAYAFARDSSPSTAATRLTTAFGLPLSRWSGRSAFTLDVSVILLDTVVMRVIRRDTTIRVQLQEPAAAEAFLQFYVDLDAPPANYVLRATVRDSAMPVAGRVMGGAQVLAAFARGRLALSDLVVVQPGGGGVWQRNGIALKPALVGVEQQFGLYYEAYGLDEQRPYTTDVEVREKLSTGRRLTGREPALMRVSFEDMPIRNPSGSDARVRTISHELKPGEYRLMVRLRQSGRTAEREARLIVIKPDG